MIPSGAYLGIFHGGARGGGVSGVYERGAPWACHASRLRPPQAKILGDLDFKNPPDAISQYRFLLIKDDVDPLKLYNF